MNARRIQYGASVLMLIVAPVASAFAQNADRIAEARAQYDEAYRLVLSENWLDAASRFQALAASEAAGELMDDAAFWRCYAVEKQGESAERAFHCYEELREQHGNSEWADDAASALVRLGKELSVSGSGEYLAEVESMVRNQNDQVAVAAIHALANAGNNDVLPALERTLERSSSPVVKRAVVQSLYQINTTEARDLLIDIARTDTEPRVRVEALRALGSLEAREAGPIIADILNSADDPNVQRASVHALHSIGGRTASRALLEFIRGDGSSSAKRDAVYAAGEIGGEDVLQAMSQLLVQSDALEVKVAAVHALHRLDSATSRRELIRVLTESDEPRIRRVAAMTLAEPENNEGVDALKAAALGDPSQQVRESAVHALSEIGTAEARAALQDVLLESTGAR
jgi:HEAT repeat protein